MISADEPRERSKQEKCCEDHVEVGREAPVCGMSVLAWFVTPMRRVGAGVLALPAPALLRHQVTVALSMSATFEPAGQISLPRTAQVSAAMSSTSMKSPTWPPVVVPFKVMVSSVPAQA